jgi:hypothetical protein
MQGINDDQSFEENLNDVSDDKGDPGTISLKGKDTFLNAKNKRRSKKDKVGRNYLCGCGKEYLSYPALYTHIKTKHDGVQPEGTKAHSASTSKRGRPKKVSNVIVSLLSPLSLFRLISKERMVASFCRTLIIVITFLEWEEHMDKAVISSRFYLI